MYDSNTFLIFWKKQTFSMIQTLLYLDLKQANKVWVEFINEKLLIVLSNWLNHAGRRWQGDEKRIQDFSWESWLAYLGVDGEVTGLLMSVLKTGCGSVYWVHLIRIAKDINEYSAPISAEHALTDITVGYFCFTTPPLCYNPNVSLASVC